MKDLLRRAGFGEARLEPWPADASKRYARLVGGPVPALLMETPEEDYLRSFLRVRDHLAAAGVPVPALRGHESRAAIVEEIGEGTMAEALDGGADPVALYAAAGRTLALLRRAPPPPGQPDWDAAAMHAATAATFLDWWWPAVLGTPPDDAARAAFRAAMLDTLRPHDAVGFVHRDFFPANLIPLPDGMAVIDFQDAARGHPLYDLVSLVEDARRDVAEAARAAAIRESGAGTDAAAMAALAAGRHLRVAGLWVRLDRRDGKGHYLRHGPRVWAHLGRALGHPACAPLRDFMDHHVPSALRANPRP